MGEKKKSFFCAFKSLNIKSWTHIVLLITGRWNASCIKMSFFFKLAFCLCFLGKCIFSSSKYHLIQETALIRQFNYQNAIPWGRYTWHLYVLCASLKWWQNCVQNFYCSQKLLWFSSKKFLAKDLCCRHFPRWFLILDILFLWVKFSKALPIPPYNCYSWVICTCKHWTQHALGLQANFTNRQLKEQFC